MNPEKPNLPTSETEHVEYSTEELVAKTEGAVEECMRNPHSDFYDRHELYHAARHSDFGPMYKKYESHEIFHLSDIQKNIEKLTEYLGLEKSNLKETDEEYQVADRADRLLKERTKTIQDGIRAYIKTLQQFYVIGKRRHFLDQEDFRDKFLAIDRQRKNAHDTLIQALTVYSRTVKDLAEYGFLEDHKIIEWTFGVDMENLNGDESTIVIFSDQILSDRDLVKDWALSAHMHQQLARIEEIQNSGTE